ncbi:hypothetical protein IFR05_013384 [Cadophora sp. M221]|nr:hypothetical protein IFR05_013384 [Cadophora sp. M221]
MRFGGFEMRSRGVSPVVKRPAWIVPFERNSRFTGRQVQLTEVEEKLFSGGSTRTAIVGLGGVGKTQLALELAYQVRDKYRNCAVIWIPATNTESLHQAYLDVARQLGIAGCEDIQADVKRLVKDHLSKESAGQWLLVFDNADDINMWTGQVGSKLGSDRLINYLPSSKHGCILFTSRDRKTAVKLAQQNIIQLTEMGEDVALQLLQKCLIDPGLVNDKSNTKTLLQELTYLPLAIVQAAAYINENGIAFADYLSLLTDQEEEVIKLLSEEFEDHGMYRNVKNPVATTWLISFQQIRHRDPLVADYLSFMCCIDPKDIPQSLLPPGPSRKKEIDAIGTLDAYSFISKRPADQALDLHRLVHLATRNWLRKEQLLAQWTESVVERLEDVFPDDDHNNRSIWRTYLPHARCVLESSLGDRDRQSRLSLSWRYAICLYADGQWNEAEAAYIEGLEIEKKELGADHPDTLISMANLASTYRNQGRWEKAEKLELQVMETRKTKLGADHPDTLSSIANLASTFRKQGRWEEAEKLQLEVMETSKTKLGADHPHTLSSMANLAATYRSQGRWEEAEKLELQVMKTSKTKLGADHPDTLSSIANLASTYRKQGRWKEAEKLELQVMETRKTKLGADHPDTLSSIASFASTYRNQGRWEEAEKLQLEVMETSKTKLGADHPDTLSSIANLASTFRQQGRWEEAEKLQLEVMETSKTKLGADHPNTLSSIANLASTYSEQGRWDEAEKLKLQVMETSKTKLGADHPDTLTSIANLALTFSNQGRWEEAEKLELQVMETSKTKLGAEHPDTLTSMSNLAWTYRNQGRWEEAEKLQLQVIETSKTKLGADHPSTLTSINNLAFTWKSQGRVDDAINLMEECVTLRTQMIGINHPNTSASQTILLEWQTERLRVSDIVDDVPNIV